MIIVQHFTRKFLYVDYINISVCFNRVFCVQMYSHNIEHFVPFRLDKYCLTRIVFTLLLSPPMAFFYWCILYVYMFGGYDELPTVVTQSIGLATEGLTELYLSSRVLGSWVYVTVLTCVWPLWLAMWSINFQ